MEYRRLGLGCVRLWYNNLPDEICCCCRPPAASVHCCAGLRVLSELCEGGQQG